MVFPQNPMKLETKIAKKGPPWSQKIPGVIGLFRRQNPILQRKDPFSHWPALSGRSSGKSFRGKLKGDLGQTRCPARHPDRSAVHTKTASTWTFILTRMVSWVLTRPPTHSRVLISNTPGDSWQCTPKPLLLRVRKKLPCIQVPSCLEGPNCFVVNPHVFVANRNLGSWYLRFGASIYVHVCWSEFISNPTWVEKQPICRGYGIFSPFCWLIHWFRKNLSMDMGQNWVRTLK